MRLDRLTRVENYILQQGSVSFDRLSEEFELSINTARRDIAELEKRGRITRVRGGAVSKVSSKSLAEIDAYRQTNWEAKQVVGSVAARLVKDGQTMFTDAGSTAQALIPYLKGKHLTIVTNSVSVLCEAARLPTVTLIVLGGEYCARSDELQSYSALADLNSFNIDIAFLGATGVSIEGGFTTATYMEVAFKQSALKRAQKSVIMVDHSKFGRQSSSKFADISDVDAIVTDRPIPADLMAYCTNCGTQVLFPTSDEAALPHQEAPDALVRK